MDKEEAKKILREVHENSVFSVRTALETFLPELKESNNERIRKGLTILVNDWWDRVSTNNMSSREEMLAWLEKVKDFDKQLEQAYKTADEVQYKRGYDKGYMDGYWYWRGAIEELGKQATIKDGNSIDPQFAKPITTTETKYPKFKGGDWINGYYTNYKVLSVNNEGYVVEDVDGNKINILFENEKFHRLWSIADAKDGDILIDVYGNIGIYEKCDDFDWMSYCSLGHNGGFQHFKIEHENEKTYPATKEQCDTFFAKIEEAGYIWNATTKELSQLSVTKKSDKVWSEEDESKIIDSIYEAINVYYLNYPFVLSQIKDWLKSIKQRPL